MALTINTQDIDNFPGTTKTVSVDLSTITSTGSEGDESYILKVATSAYSKITEGSKIQDMYITGFVSGWLKSSGFVGSSGKYFIDSTHNKLKIKLDATPVGQDGNGFYTITLTHNDDNTPIDGDAIAEDMEKAIQALAASLETADVGFSAAYRNALVEYKNGKFWIVSGSISKYYTGSNRSSVVVIAADTDDCSKELGFDLPISSAALSTVAVKETLLNTDYVAGTGVLSVNTGTGAKEGCAYVITDGENTDYFVTLSGTTDSTLMVATEGANGFSAIQHSYSAYETKLQLLREQDPEPSPKLWFNNVDALIRYGIKSMINQIDYSS